MSAVSTMPEQPGTAKSQRVLACILCQQRKVKCDRKFPCANCVRAGAQCTPAASLAPRQRRRRFPERELLDRLRHYEDLLRQNDVEYEPLHPSGAGLPSSSGGQTGSASLDEVEPDDTLSSHSSGKAATKVKLESVSLWHAIGTRSLHPQQDDVDDVDDDVDTSVEDDGTLLHDSDDVRETVFRKAWDRTFESNSSDHLLFGSPEANEDLSTLHPDQVQVFKLWQIYLENVDPLLKVTHAPTLQARIIEAVSNIGNISPPLEALIFAVYCISIISLEEDECAHRFGHSTNELLTRYQYGCRRALQKSSVLRTSDLDCLTALYLYLLSARPEIDPRSLSSMLGMAIRIARRIGIHNESSCSRWPPLQAELRRRLWWSLVVFDNRICEMFDYQNSSLTPMWDCGTPANLNDFEVRPEMKTLPVVHEYPTEAVFTVVRSEISDFIRHSGFHLDFINPDLKVRNKDGPPSQPNEDGLCRLEKTIEEKYIACCNPENPLQFMTIWSSRGYIAKTRLLDYYARHSKLSVPQTDVQRNAIASHALSMLECDTTLRTSPLTKGYLWFVEFNFPFPAYMHLLQNLKRRPYEDYADKAWKIMSDNYTTRIKNYKNHGAPLLVIFSRMVLQAWQSRETFFKQSEKSPIQPPLIVSALRSRLEKLDHPCSSQTDDIDQGIGASAINDDISALTSMGLKSFQNQEIRNYTDSNFWAYPDNHQFSTTDFDMDHFDWNAMDWNSINL